MTLFDGKISQVYFVQEIRLESVVMRRLEALGFNEGTRIQIMNRKKNGAMIVKVRGTRLALGKMILKGIDVKEDLL